MDLSSKTWTWLVKHGLKTISKMWTPLVLQNNFQFALVSLSKHYMLAFSALSDHLCWLVKTAYCDVILYFIVFYCIPHYL